MDTSLWIFSPGSDIFCMMSEYAQLLEDEVFKSGEFRGSLRASLTILTDMLIELNSLELFYQKPVSKSVTPKEIANLREKIEHVKVLVQTSLVDKP